MINTVWDIEEEYIWAQSLTRSTINAEQDDNMKGFAGFYNWNTAVKPDF